MTVLRLIDGFWVALTLAFWTIAASVVLLALTRSL